MREILFRGKRSDNGEWIIGSFTNWYQLCFDNETPKMGIVTEFELVYHDCIPETIGQYTGLIDKNGKKIFEGDIISCKGNIFEMKFIDGFAAFDLRSICNMGSVPCLTPNTVSYMSVIGNIYDNPELLKG